MTSNEQLAQKMTVTNYASAAARHWNDAEHLLSDSRQDNADQFFGFSAECAIKTALFNEAATNGNAQLPKTYLVHIDELWDKTNSAALRKRYPTLSAVLKTPNPFSDWSTHHRYADSGTIAKSQVDAHRKVTQRLLGAVQIVGIRSKD